jgi:AcrR family transcriptional regulator
MSKLHPSTLNADSTKAKIFFVAAQLFAEKGYNGVSMREISERSEVSKPTIYYYFKNKEGIYRNLMDTGILHNVQNLKRVQKMNIPVRKKLSEIMKVHFKYSTEYPEFSTFFLRVFFLSESLPFLRQFESKSHRQKRALIELIQDGIDSGEFGAGADAELASEIFAAVQGHFMMKQRNSKKKILSDKLADRIVELLFKGLNE